MTDAIKAAADALADAKMKAESGAGALADASAKVDQVRARIATLDSERAEIVAARKAGKTSKAHGPRLAEISADLEGLNEIHAEAIQAHGAAAAEYARLNQAVTAAEYALATASDHALLGDLRQIATELDGRLRETVSEISAVAKRLGLNRAQWLPTAELANGIRRLDLENGGLHR